jgi:hypothetical protein
MNLIMLMQYARSVCSWILLYAISFSDISWWNSTSITVCWQLTVLALYIYINIAMKYSLLITFDSISAVSDINIFMFECWFTLILLYHFRRLQLYNTAFLEPRRSSSRRMWRCVFTNSASCHLNPQSDRIIFHSGLLMQTVTFMMTAVGRRHWSVQHSVVLNFDRAS